RRLQKSASQPGNVAWTNRNRGRDCASAVIRSRLRGGNNVEPWKGESNSLEEGKRGHSGDSPPSPFVFCRTNDSAWRTTQASLGWNVAGDTSSAGHVARVVRKT